MRFGATAIADETPQPDSTAAPCPQPPEYWRTHPDRWPTDVVTLGDRGYTEDELLSLLSDEDNTDASLVLGHELIAAKLNRLGGTGPLDGATLTADDALRGFDRKLPLIVATETNQGRQMVWFSGLLWGNNRRCGEVQGASDTARGDTTSAGLRAGPSGLPGTGGGLVPDNSVARWAITVLCLIVGVLLVMFLRRSFAGDDEPDD